MPCVVDYRTEKTEVLDGFKEVFTCNFVARVDLIQTFIDYKEKWLQYHIVPSKFNSYTPPENKEQADKLTSTDIDVKEYE